MSLKHEIKATMAREGIKLIDLSNMINKANNTNYNYTNLSQKINNETMKYTEVEQLLDILGYDIVWKKRE